MYEAPKLIVIGDAREVILGGSDAGYDLDGTYFDWNWAYGNDGKGSPPPQSSL